MRWAAGNRKKSVIQPNQWHSWFAWFPVEIEGYWFWLETVARKGTPHQVLGPDMEPETIWEWEYR